MSSDSLTMAKYDVFNHMNVGVIVLEQDLVNKDEFVIRYLNKRVEKFSSIKFRKFINHSVKEAFPKAYDYKLHLAFKKCLITQKPFRIGEILYGDENLDSQYVDVELVPENANTLILYYTNITKHILKVKELEIKNKELTHFAHVASHDLVEPINTIQGYINLLKAKLSIPHVNPNLKYIEVINQSAIRMKKMVTGLLDFSKLNQPQDWQPLQLAITIKEVVADLSQVIEETNAKIYVDIIPEILGHPVQMRSLFQNLISNAIKFHHPNITPVIKIGVIPELDFWHFYVADNGIGVDQKDKEKIFLMFERLNGKENYDGAGIGLAHCQKIVKLHLGEIWVESEVGKGSTFHFKIPKEPIVPK